MALERVSGRAESKENGGMDRWNRCPEGELSNVMRDHPAGDFSREVGFPDVYLRGGRGVWAAPPCLKRGELSSILSLLGIRYRGAFAKCLGCGHESPQPRKGACTCFGVVVDIVFVNPSRAG